jgi:hypothetical protein
MINSVPPMAVKQTCIPDPGGKNSPARSGRNTGTQGGGNTQRHRGKEILTHKDNEKILRLKRGQFSCFSFKMSEN